MPMMIPTKQLVTVAALTVMLTCPAARGQDIKPTPDRKATGDRVEIVVLRGTERLTLTATLGQR